MSNNQATEAQQAEAAHARTLLRKLQQDASYEPTESELAQAGTWRDTFALVLSAASSEQRKRQLDILRKERKVIRLLASTPPDEHLAEQQLAEPSEQWQAPLPLDCEYAPAQFPLEVLPRWCERFARELSISTQTPPALAGMLTLAALSTALQRSATVLLTDDWSEPINLYVLCAAESGSRKSAVVSAISKPIVDYEREQIAVLAPELADKQSERRSKELELAKLEKRLADCSADERQMLNAERRELARELAEQPLPAEYQLLIGDCTAEQLASALAAQGGKLAMMTAEAGLLETITRYLKTGSQPNIDILLCGHTAETVRIDRKTRSELIVKPALTIGAAIQPSVLRGMAAHRSLHERGLIPRFLLAMPQDMLGSREIEPPVMRGHTRAHYEQRLDALLRQADSMTEAVTLRLEPAAYTALKEFRRWLEPQLERDAALGTLRSWASKLPGALARVAALLHLAEHGYAPLIGVDAMQRALHLAPFLIEHAQAAFGVMSAAPAHQSAQRILRWLGKSERREFRKAELLAGVRASFKTARELDAPLELLIDYGYLRKLDAPLVRAGRPAERYAVNPLLYAEPAAEPREHLADEPSASYAEPPAAELPTVEHLAEPAAELPTVEHLAEPAAEVSDAELEQRVLAEKKRNKQMIARLQAQAQQIGAD